MQRTHVRKRLTALLLTLVMLLGIIPTAWADPQAPRPMEVHGFQFNESDALFIAEEQLLHVEFWGVPTEGSQFDQVTLIIAATSLKDGSPAGTLALSAPATPTGRDQYVAEFTIDGAQYAHTRMNITCLTITDTTGANWAEGDGSGSIGFEFQFNDAYSADMAVTALSVDKSTVTLTDANYDATNDVTHNEWVTLTMQLQLPSGFTIPVDGNGDPAYELQFAIRNDNTEDPTHHEIGGAILETDASGTIYAECDMGVDFWWGEGTYHIEWVKYYEYGEDAVYLPLNGSNIALQVIHAQTDKTAPVVSDAYYTLNGVRQTEGGFRVKPTDTLEFHITVTDASLIRDNTTGLMSWNAPDCDLNAHYDAAAGELIATIPVDQMAATEWYMNYFHANDVFENIVTFNITEPEDHDLMKHLYFYLEDANGNCDIPTRTVLVRFHGCGDPTPEVELRDMPRVFDLSDALGQAMPTASVPAGRTFLGWYNDSHTRPTYTTADDLVVMYDNGEVNLFPVYDQAVFTVHYNYIDNNTEVQWQSIELSLPYGGTMQDALDAAADALAQLPHDPSAGFQGWTCENDLSQVLDPTFEGFSIDPIYTSLPVHVEYSYTTQDGYTSESEVTAVYVPAGSTVAQLKQQLLTELTGLPHHSDLTVQGWNVDHGDNFTFSMQSLREMGGFHMNAWPQYDKAITTVHYGYIDEKGERQWVDMPLMLPSSATVQDAIDAAVDLNSLQHYGKINLVDWQINANLSEPAANYSHIHIDPVYDKVPVRVNYRYMQADGTYQWTTPETELEVFVAPGSTVGDVLTAAGLDKVTHYAGLTLQGWNTDGMQMTDEIGWGFGGQNFDAVYDKTPVTVFYAYWDENGEAQVCFTALLVNSGATVQDVTDAFDAFAAGLKHWDDAGFTQQWQNVYGEDPNMTVWPGYETAFVAEYQKTLPAAYGEDTFVTVGYYDEKLIYCEYTVPYDANASKTYRQMMEEAISTVANAHNSALTLMEWDLCTPDGAALEDETFLDKTAQSQNVGIYVYADYTDLVVDVWYSYRNASGEVVDDMFSVIVDRTATYQDVLDKITLPTDHSTACGFVEWNHLGLDLTEKVEGSSRILEAYATYEKYPVTYSYTYLGTGGESVHVTQTKMVDAGTDATAFFDTLTGVAHHSGLTFKRWVLTKSNYNAQGEVGLWTGEIAMMAEYEEATPVCVEFQELNSDLELVESRYICYVDGTTNDTAPDELFSNALDQVVNQVNAPSGFQIMGAGEMMEDYIPMTPNYYSGLYYQLCISYDKAVLKMYYPDETTEKVVFNEGEQYTLPATHDGKAVEWYGADVYNGKVNVWGPVCEVYGEYVICYHKLTHTAAKAATCTADGSIEHYTCSACEKTFADEKGKNELAADKLVVKSEGHKMTKTEAKAATCSADGSIAYYTCSVCTKFFADEDGKTELTAADLVVDAKGHKMTKTEAKAATCTADGNVEYYTCSVCTKTFADEKGKTELAAADLVVKSEGHKMAKTEAKAATCTADGNIEYYTCSACEKTFADEKGKTELAAADLVVKSEGHKLTKTEAKAATYTAEGNIEYYTCSVCSKIFADAKGEKAITAADTVTAKLPAVVVDKAENKEEVKVELKEEAAEEVIDKALEEAKAENKAPSVVIDVHKDTVDAVQKEDAAVKEEEIKVTEVSIPTATVEKVAEADKKSTLAVNLTTATIIMDNKAMEAVVEQAAGDSVSLVVTDMEVSSLKPNQQNAVHNKKVALTISAELVCNTTGEKIATKDAKGFGGGTVTMAVPLPEELPEGIKASDLKVYFVADDGTVEHVPSKLDENGNIIFDLKHFSEYVIAADAPAAPSAPATGDSFPVMLVTAALLISAAGIVILSRKSKRA